MTERRTSAKHGQKHGSFSENKFRSKKRFSGRRSKGNGQKSQRIDVSKFVNKAIIPEKAQEFKPKNRFEDFQINEKLKHNIARKGYINPTPIQDEAIPHILEGKDLLGIAATGTGKTASFLIPLINKVLHNRAEKVLIVAPTRELALQIQEEFIGFSHSLNIYSTLCIGGSNIGKQIATVKRNPNFIIGTPGRLKDFIQRKLINLSGFRNVVLDEADRMLDMGFIHDVKFLLELMPTNRHSLFFSATVSAEVKGLIANFLRDPVTVSVKTRETSLNVDQDIIRIENSQKKVDILHDLLLKAEFQKVIIFGKTKFGVEKLSVALEKRGFKVAAIHGNKSQSKRQQALNLFKENRIQILVATDVAARGLDISDVSHVINYDQPATYDDYIHRIGRTGRANKTGKALTFVG